MIYNEIDYENFVKDLLKKSQIFKTKQLYAFLRKTFVTNDDVIKSECSDVTFIMDKELLDNLLLTPMNADKKKAMLFIYVKRRLDFNKRSLSNAFGRQIV